MNPVTSSVVLIVSVFFNLLMLVLLLRFLLQLVGADFYNPISQAIARITNPLLHPLRKIIPPAVPSISAPCCCCSLEK